MVERIDRPEAPPPYQITRTKESKESLHQGSNPREEAEEKFRKELENNKEWGKFHRREVTVRPMRVKRDAIERVLFRAAVLRSGTAILVGDIVWKNGQTTEGALFLLARVEDYFRLKSLRPKSDVPESFWALGNDIDIGIPEERGSSGSIVLSQGSSRPGTKPQPQRVDTTHSWLITFGFIHATTGRPNWATIVGFGIALAIFLAVIFKG
ncbi:MAG: hypothetical protein HY465_02535 [Deltaproteobacteria bacterium]|nr:hypothetical protein [Deltaproteobacteria bacterium]